MSLDVIDGLLDRGDLLLGADHQHERHARQCRDIGKALVRVKGQGLEKMHVRGKRGIARRHKKRIAVGLGVSNREQAAQVSKYADGVIVGSAFTRHLLENQNIDDALKAITNLAKELSGSMQK